MRENKTIIMIVLSYYYDCSIIMIVLTNSCLLRGEASLKIIPNSPLLIDPVAFIACSSGGSGQRLVRYSSVAQYIHSYIRYMMQKSIRRAPLSLYVEYNSTNN